MAEDVIHAPDNLRPDIVCDGGNLDCGSGLLLLIRKSINQVPAGGILEIRSTEISVREDLPAWCRMTKNPYLGWRLTPVDNQYFVRKGETAAAEVGEEKQARDYRWQCRVRWSEGLQSTVYCRNHQWQVGQPASFDVEDAAPSAVEYVLGALGACLAMGFQMRASQRGIRIDELEIALGGQIENIYVFLGVERQGHSGFRSISGTLYVRADADEKVLQALWQQTLAASPVTNTLTRSTPVEIVMQYVP
jgi:uncharacterized OsmC-like protein/TusA-related sulfurtransferase